MRIYFTIFLIILLSAISFIGISQCNSINVTSPASVCKKEFFEMTNNTSASSYGWDFCPGDLVKTPYATNLAKIGFSSAFDLSIIEDQGKWYAFSISINANSIRRIDLGADLSSITAVDNNLGNPGGLLSAPTSLKIVKQGNIWFGLVFNQSSNSIVALNFGTSLLNTAPTASVVVTGVGGVEGALDIIQLGASSFVVLVSNNSGTVSSIPFPNGLDQPAGTITNTSVGGYLVDIQIVDNCNSYSAIVLRYDTRNLIRLDYGNNFASTPVITALPANQFNFSPYRLWIGKEGNNIYGMASNIGGGVANIDFGTDITNANPTVTDFGNLASSLVGSYSIFAVNQNSNWTAFTINGTNSNMYSLTFPNLPCDASIQSSVNKNPGLISYSTSGTKAIIAKVTYADGTVENKTIPISVQNLDAPTFFIDSVPSKCLGVNINFTVNTSATLQTLNWDFGDGFSSTSPTPSHQFATIGNFAVKLKATNTAGCSSINIKNVQIFNPPVSTFTLPTNNPLCTNQQLTFTNTSTFDAGSNPTWEWFVNGSSVSTTKDLQQAFSSNSSQTIKLKASILGCFNESSQVINSLLAGPQVGFTSFGKCENNAVTFTNTTTDPVTDYLWDFGDSQTSSSTNASHVYTSFGTYGVVLQGTSANGCQNSTKQNLTIYTNPVPDFSLSLPPFSCTGSPSQFNDLTPNPVDSNLASWLWSFDDPSSGLNSSAIRNAQHTYSTAGDYNVSLTAKTNFGCQATVVKKVTVSQAPQVAFSNSPACQNQGTTFSDESDNAQSWFWQIENTTYSIKNPIHVFAASGNYTVNLTVTSTNNCISFLSKAVNVPKPLVPDFSFQKNCVDQNTEFVDLTDGSNDPVTTQQWTFGTLGTATGSPTIFTFPSVGAVSTTMDVTAQSGCKYSITKSVSIQNAPTALFTANPEAGVPPLDVTFSNSSSNATSYLWTFNDSNNTTSTDVSPSFTFNEIGDHLVDLTAYNNLGCSDTFSKIIKAMLPVYDISLIGFNIIKNDDGSLKLIAALHNEGNVSVTNMSLELSLSGVTSVREAVTESISPQASANHILNYEITDASKLEFLCVTVILAND
ncbi:MAG TPA: PKD domain-containing protein, partial [Cyclobacteriaceae bacterium]|nr:PKD domain-containing protein [Cyclobacteriaceae bacterium]